ncbi:hypothetical protein RXV86_01860 [Alisedimentitalea sp. MJ-SS2]|uniref:hypothetical protein n=1 Tax=Aliisedimentitalea sp. MJ-SS2 TaxID=3049795 RepID=UPI00290B59AA|nr:hypothetical protein [Alisedimentitalea sp. MJ-SS2]MDU8926121.1 hypothetical protein [Alisedimentitalea sp. MJ-SS2]
MQLQFKALEAALEAKRFVTSKAENEQDYGTLQWVSEVCFARRVYDGLMAQLRFQGMGDDALTTLPMDEAQYVELFVENEGPVSELYLRNPGAKSDWNKRVRSFLSVLDEKK